MRQGCGGTGSETRSLRLSLPDLALRASADGVFGKHRDFGPAGRNTRILKLQIARIAKLLDELEQFARTTENLPPTIAGQTHAGIERGRIILQPFSGCEREAGREDDIEGDPQPHIDDEMLERMYRELNPDA